MFFNGGEQFERTKSISEEGRFWDEKIMEGKAVRGRGGGGGRRMRL